MTASSNMVAAFQRLSGRELLINTETADEFVANMIRFSETDREQAAAHEVTSREQLCAAYGIDDRPEGEGRKPFVYQDGVAVIPVHGALINRFNSSWGFVTGYNFIRRQMNLILDDDDVDYFIFDVNTPGGEASGCFELGREIIASRRVKPSLAMVDSLAASGGMAIAGSATKMYGIPSARIGSIGVYRQHISVEGALKDAGVKITYATAGEHKVDGNPFQDLPDNVLKEWTADVNETWDDFIALVAEARDMDPAAVRETQARVYRADKALALGLINAVKTTADAVPAFVAEMADDTIDEEDDDMDNGKKTEATSVDYEKIGSMISAGVATAMTGFLAAQNRATAIREHGKAKGQAALAAKLSANDKFSEAEAIEMIDAAADAAPKKPAVKAPKPNNRVEDEGGEGDDDDLDEDEDGGEGDEGDEGEDDADQARARRQGRQRVRGGGKRDEVNHFDNAMRGKGAGVGAGEGGEKLTGDAAATATLLGDYAAHTGTVLGKKAA